MMHSQRRRFSSSTTQMNSAMSAPPPRAASGSQASTSQACEALKQRFPCREAIIDQLRDMIVHGSTAGPVLAVGPPATGKTAVVRAALRACGQRHAYVSCIEAVHVQPVLSSVLHQLKGSKRLREDGYDTPAKCINISDFLLQLPAAAAAAAGARRTGAGMLKSSAHVATSAAPHAAAANFTPCWVVVDHAERLAGSELLAALASMRSVMRTNVGLVLISADMQGTRSGPWGEGPDALVCQVVEFPAYKPAELSQIVQQRQVRHAGTAGQLGPAFRQFLDTFVPAFCRASRNLLDLQAAVDRLFPLYAQPLREGKALQAPALYNRIRQQVAVMVRELDFRGGGGGASDSDRPGLVVASGASGAAEGGAGAAGAWDLDLGGAGGGGIDEEAADRRVSARGLAFQLPYVCKFLMLASYVASRNKPSTDRVVFDPTHKKRVKRGGQANDRQAEAALEAKLRGPHTFPLERLLHIFFAIYPQEEEEEGRPHLLASLAGGGGAGAAGRDGVQKQGRTLERALHSSQRTMLQGEVLMQVSSLVALRQLAQISGDPLEGQVYRCNLTEAAAHAVAANLKVDLTDYLRLA